MSRIISSDLSEVVNFHEWRKWLFPTALGFPPAQKLVVTNGCFDVLHAGHVAYLEQARALGDALLVGINSDAAVRELKGEGRPVNNEADRAAVLLALRCVDAVTIFDNTTATVFLREACPDIWVKAGDYYDPTGACAPERSDQAAKPLNLDEVAAVQACGGQIVILPFVPGHSTTATLAKIQRL